MTRLSTGFPEDLRTRTCARSSKETYRRFHRNLFKSFSQGTVQEHAKASDSIALYYLYCARMSTRAPNKDFVKDLHQDLHARTPTRSSQERHKRKCFCWSGSRKILIQEPPRASIKSFHRSICRTSHLQDRHAITRISTRSSVEAHKSPMPQTKTSLRDPRRKLCTSLCSRNLHGHVTRAFYARTYKKLARPRT